MMEGNFLFVASWDELKSEIAAERKSAPDPKLCWFRGESKGKGESWLQTSLERNGMADFSVSNYMRACKMARDYILNHQIGLVFPDFNYEKFFGKYIDISKGYIEMQNKEFLAFLRQYEFPSPLLDWSNSPYVAAYFALNRRRLDDGKTNRIYVCKINPSYPEIEFPKIGEIGRFIHCGSRRHAIQHSSYTFALRRDGQSYSFCSHDEAMPNSNHKFRCFEFNFSYKEIETALNDLRVMNINQYTLFNTVDALLATTWHDIFEAVKAPI
jgi:hypothetical protein